MSLYNSQITNNDNKTKQKVKKSNENHFQLKTDHIRGHINNIKLTFLYLRRKRT